MQGNGRYYSTPHISPLASYSMGYGFVRVLKLNPEHFETYSLQLGSRPTRPTNLSPSSSRHKRASPPIHTTTSDKWAED